MILANNGRQSSGHHIKIHYYFITDNICHGTMCVKYCCTSDMMGDFFMKPLQGSHFCKFCSEILNLDHELPPNWKECVGTPGMNIENVSSGAQPGVEDSTWESVLKEDRMQGSYLQVVKQCVMRTSCQHIPQICYVSLGYK